MSRLSDTDLRELTEDVDAWERGSSIDRATLVRFAGCIKPLVAEIAALKAELAGHDGPMQGERRDDYERRTGAPHPAPDDMWLDNQWIDKDSHI